MKDKWYGDKRDVVKWSVLHHLARIQNATRVLQIAYYRPEAPQQVEIDGQVFDVPDAIQSHFRDIRKIALLASDVRVTVFDVCFDDREPYREAVTSLLRAFDRERCLVFLDPDTGLEPAGAAGFEHVLDQEVADLWEETKENDTLVFYQHQTNRGGQPWIEPKRQQLAEALGIATHDIRVAHGQQIAHDVVFFFVQKLV